MCKFGKDWSSKNETTDQLVIPVDHTLTMLVITSTIDCTGKPLLTYSSFLYGEGKDATLRAAEEQRKLTPIIQIFSLKPRAPLINYSPSPRFPKPLFYMRTAIGPRPRRLCSAVRKLGIPE